MSTVLVTGLSGRLGRVLAKMLHRDHHVIGIDRRAFVGKPKDVDVYRLDIRRKKCEDVFRQHKIDAVVHMGIMHDPRETARTHHTFNIVGTTRLLEYCHRYKVPKVVLLSSANVYGPNADNPNFITEDHPLMGGTTFSEIRDLIEVDFLAQSFFWKHPEVETVILRPVHIVGSVMNAPSNYLRLRYVPTLMGFDPMVQLIHEEDVVEAIKLAIDKKVRGIFNVVGPGTIPLSAAISALGRVQIPVPQPIAKSIVNFLWRSKLTSFPAPELDYLQYHCTVDGTRAKELLGFHPKKTLRETLERLRGSAEA